MESFACRNSTHAVRACRGKGWTWTNFCSQRMTLHRKRKKGSGQGRNAKTASLPCSQGQNITEESQHISWLRCGVPSTSSHMKSCLKLQNPTWSWESNRQTKRRVFPQKLPYQSYLRWPWKTRKEHETVIAKRRVGDVMTTCSVGSRRESWDRERSFVENPGTSKYILSNIPNPSVTTFLALFWQAYCCGRC